MISKRHRVEIAGDTCDECNCYADVLYYHGQTLLCNLCHDMDVAMDDGIDQLFIDDLYHTLTWL